MKDLLIEILVEEIPADFAYPASMSFKKIMEDTLKNNGISFKSIIAYTTPRRLSVLVEEVEEKSKDEIVESRGPLLESAIKDGSLTKAGEGFLKSHNIDNIKNIDEKEDFNKAYIKEVGGKKYLFVKKEKKGETALTTGILFLACIFLARVAAIIPAAATSSALIYVGVLMLQGLKNVDFEDMDQMVPVSLMLIGMPISGSIGHAIGIGLISYTIIKVFGGKAKEVSVLTYAISLLFLVKFFLAV